MADAIVSGASLIAALVFEAPIDPQGLTIHPQEPFRQFLVRQLDDSSARDQLRVVATIDLAGSDNTTHLEAVVIDLQLLCIVFGVLKYSRLQ